MPNSRLKTATLGVIGLFTAANGVWMIAGPTAWFAAVPGVTDTGPLNAHFVRDVGAAYLTVAACIGLAWRRPASGFPLLLAGSVFMVLHALSHLWESLTGRLPMTHLLMDLPGVLVPALLLPVSAWWWQTDRVAERSS